MRLLLSPSRPTALVYDMNLQASITTSLNQCLKVAHGPASGWGQHLHFSDSGHLTIRAIWMPNASAATPETASRVLPLWMYVSAGGGMIHPWAVSAQGMMYATTS